MRFSALGRTTTFRLARLYGLAFALGVGALLGVIYLRSTVYLSHRINRIIASQAGALERMPAGDLSRRITETLALRGDKTSIAALFAADGAPIAGNLSTWPSGLRADAGSLDVAPGLGEPAMRLTARRLPSGQILVVGRDIDQLSQIREIMTSALVWSGAAIVLAGLGGGIVLSIRPLARLRALQAAGQRIAEGDLKQRMPVSRRDDELDMLAGAVNHMMDEVERLMAEVKGATETIAHDLLTPLARVGAQLNRIARADGVAADELRRPIAGIDEVLDRFRAILRISELEARARRVGFQSVDLMDVIGPVAELYQPLAEAKGLWFSSATARGVVVEADPKLLIEALSNLVDNAIKFTPPGGCVEVRLEPDSAPPRVVVQDNGPGIPAEEREAVLQRFYRGERYRSAPGAGLGLSIVSAIVRLHGFAFRFEDAAPGLRAVIEVKSLAST